MARGTKDSFVGIDDSGRSNVCDLTAKFSLELLLARSLACSSITSLASVVRPGAKFPSKMTPYAHKRP